MNQFIVNGVQKELPVSTESSIRDLLKAVRSQYLSETAIISSIRIDGNEIIPGDEVLLSGVSIGQVNSFEIRTVHPSEMADETLQIVKQFTQNLEYLSQQAAENIREGKDGPQLMQLIDGLSTMTEAIGRVRRMNRLGAIQEVNVLEADLLSMLKDLLQFQEAGNTEFTIDLLRQHLPANMKEWREKGIPAMLKARSS